MEIARLGRRSKMGDGDARRHVAESGVVERATTRKSSGWSTIFSVEAGENGNERMVCGWEKKKG